MSRPLRVLIAHDFMETFGGAERVTAELARAFPEAPVHALLGVPAVAARMGVADRFHPVLPARHRIVEHYRRGAPFFPALAAARALPEADVLLTSSYGFAHHFRTVNAAPQVCYCHSPLRFAWSMEEEYGATWAHGPIPRGAFTALGAAMRRVDLRGSRRVERYLTQSSFTADQIARFYGRTAAVVGAPIDCRRFRPASDPPEDFWLFVGRLVEPYKRIGATVEAFRRLGLPLVVAGDGPALAGLRRSAPPNVTFAGHLEDDDLVALMQRCRAALFPSRDDFGLVPLEVNACGRPVLAFAGGGALHTVAPGVSGALFSDPSPGGIEAAVRAFRPEGFEPALVREHARRWDTAAFRARVVAEVTQAAEARTG